MHRVFTKQAPSQGRSKLSEINLRGWPTGWNAIHSDIAMDVKSLVSVKNFVRQANGDMKLRYGSKWVADGSSVAMGTRVLDMVYFGNRVVCVTDQSEVFTVDDDGVTAIVWEESIANALVGAPDGWGATYKTIDFVPFKTSLVIHNGVDKPISLSSTFVASYLQDLATGSNVNTPIGKYGCVVGDYHCVAGVPDAPTTVYISAKGTAGTFLGDPAPNDAIEVDVGAYASEGSIIIGIAGFRSYLLVFFETQTLPVLLGNYDNNGNHVPQFPDVLPQFGLIGHRCITPLPSDIQFNDLNGLANASRNLLSGLFDTQHLSAYIEPEYRKAVGSLTETQRRRDCFSVWDKLNKGTILFLPTGQGFLYTFSEDRSVRYRSWSELSTPLWECACTSVLGRVFTALGMRVYQLGNGVFDGEDFSAELMEDRDGTWTNNTLYVVDTIAYDSVNGHVYKCLVQHTSATSPTTFLTDRTNHPTYWEEYLGETISFEMITPWLGGAQRLQVKQLRYTNIETNGTAEFLLELFVDRLHAVSGPFLQWGVYDLYWGANALAWWPVTVLSPIISITLVGEENDEGLRRSFGRGLFKTPTKFMRVKAKISGATTNPLTVSAMDFLYVRGRFNRYG